jgi:hypothetical protein
VSKAQVSSSEGVLSYVENEGSGQVRCLGCRGVYQPLFSEGCPHCGELSWISLAIPQPTEPAPPESGPLSLGQ